MCFTHQADFANQISFARACAVRYFYHRRKNATPWAVLLQTKLSDNLLGAAFSFADPPQLNGVGLKRDEHDDERIGDATDRQKQCNFCILHDCMY